MATFVERGGRVMARVRRDGFAPVTKTFSGRRDAERWARGVEADMEAGRWVDPSKALPTMREALADYLAVVVPTMKGAATYAYCWPDVFAQPMAAKPLDTVNAVDLARYRDDLAGRVAPGTVVRRLGMLSGFFTWAHKERGWVASNPLRSVRKPRVNDARDRTLSDEERAWLLEAARTSRAQWLADVLVVLLRSAMRRGELWGLQADAIDWEARTAHLDDTKNGTARDVPLCPEALAALRRLADAATARGEARLVPLADPHAVSLAFRRTLDRARALYERDCEGRGVAAEPKFLAGVRLHDLRHDALTMWASTGALSLPELMAVSGHRTPRMLVRYTNLSASRLAGKLASLMPNTNEPRA